MTGPATMRARCVSSPSPLNFEVGSVALTTNTGWVTPVAVAVNWTKQK
jgi:hypothetical protein